MNCLNGFFHFPPLNSLSEELQKAEGKGVIGAFSPSGLSVNDAAHLFHKALLEEIVSRRHERIGDAILAAQENYVLTGVFPELLQIYHLFGDPALTLRQDRADDSGNKACGKAWTSQSSVSLRDQATPQSFGSSCASRAHVDTPMAGR